MSIVKSGVTPLDGLTLGRGGTAFAPCDADSSYAFYERDGRGCSVIYELGIDQPFLRFSPNWMLPEGARDRRAWQRFVFELDDDRALQLKVDFRDGEVRYLYSDEPLEDLGDIERAIEEGVEFVTSLYPDVVRYVGERLGVR